MSTEPGQVRARSSSPEAERMRLYRKRRQEGIRYVRIPLHVMEVDALIRIGRLKEDSRTDAEVLQAAVLSLLYQKVLPVIQEIQESGVKSLRGIARALAARGIPTARGGEWTAVQVSAIVYRANDWFRHYQRGS